LLHHFTLVKKIQFFLLKKNIGYLSVCTFLNIQEHSKYIVKNIDIIEKTKVYNIDAKYQFLDKIFLKVLENHPEKMPNIFFNMFKTSSTTVIKFLSNKSNIFEDIKIISKMPKLVFMKALFY